MKYNRICQILGIEKPVIQGPLSWLTDARLVAAVSNAGGLGVLGPNAGLTAETAVSTPEETAEKMREEIRKTKKLTEKPFGVNLIPTPENDIWTPPILPFYPLQAGALCSRVLTHRIDIVPSAPELPVPVFEF